MNGICIYGAGSVGCYVGGRLAAAGSAVQFIGRERIRSELAAHGLRLTDYRGAELQLGPDLIRFSTTAAAAAGADLVLVTVKSAATLDAGRELSRAIAPGVLVISFQNGLGNADALSSVLPGRTVLRGMVPFNVVARGNGAFHQGSEGELMVERHPALDPWLPVFERAGMSLLQRDDMPAVQWAKLLMNLNNAINALSEVPLKTELSQRAYRRCLAMAQTEAIALLRAAGSVPARLTPLPPGWIPRLLDAPDWIFRLLANRMLAIDPLARSSMWEDLQLGRTTEVEWINGEVVRLAEELRREAPINALLVALIRAAETGGRRRWSGPELLAALRAL